MSSAATGFIANFNTGLGKYDGSSLYGVSTSQDISGAVVGSSNLNLVNGYVLNPNSFVLPSALSGANAGFTVTGWFNTSNTTIKSTIVDLSCTAPSTGNIVVNISGGVLYGNYPGATIFAAAGSVVTGGWNFFTYSVCASGGTQLVQSMYVNGTQSMLSNGGGSYVAYTVGNMFIGYGAAPYTQYLNAKVDDFRYYGRVLTPMEIRILHQYTYNNGMYSGAGGSGGALIPSLGTAPIYTGINNVVSNTYNTLPLPTTLGNVQFWYDAADPLGTGTPPANNTTVTMWYDKSGYGRHAAQYSANASDYGVYKATGFNGKPTVNFNLVSNGRTIGYGYSITSNQASYLGTSTAPTGATFFMVFQAVTGTTYNNGYWTVCTMSYSNLPNPFDYYNNGIYGSSGTFANISTQTTPTLLTTTFDTNVTASNIKQWLNGGGANGNVSSTSTYSQGFYINSAQSCGFYIGTRADKFTGMIGNISEVIMYNKELTTTQRQQVEGYLAWKWGLQANLPTGHPYLNTAPTYNATTTTSAISFALSNTGTYSHLKVARYLNGTLNANYTVSSASQPLSGGIVKSTALVPSGGGSGGTVSYTWNDICYNTGNVSGYTYSFTPVVMGSYGAASDFIACV